MDFRRRYEVLRECARGNAPLRSSSLGMSVVILRGLTGWMLYWTQPDGSCEPRGSCTSGHFSSGDRLHHEVVCVFVSMALACQEAA